jgi:branched-chain amino acid transport system substrate-binding protein
MRFRTIKIVTALGLVSVLAAACGSSKSSSTPTSAGSSSSALPATIKIGVPLDLTGSSEITGVGTGEWAGVQFAVNQINSSGFLGTSKIDPVMFDTQASKTEAVQRTVELISSDHVSAIVGYSLTPSFLAAGPIAQKDGIPVMAVGLSGAGVTEVGNYIFRELLDYTKLYAFGDPQFVKATHATTAAYLYGSDTVTTSGQYAARRKLLESLGVKTVAVETITAATTDMQAQLTAIKDANPDLLVVNVDTGQVPSVLVQLGESGITAQYLGDTSLGSAVVTGNPAAIKAAQCGLFTTPWVPTSTAGGNPLFVSQWKAANNGQTPDFFDALGRDAMWAMATAIKNANSVNPSQIRDALSQISGFSGALGLYGWNNPAAPGQPTYGGVNEQVQNGQDVPWTSSTTCTK